MGLAMLIMLWDLTLGRCDAEIDVSAKSESSLNLDGSINCRFQCSIANMRSPAEIAV
jgi:hypothetical protein